MFVNSCDRKNIAEITFSKYLIVFIEANECCVLFKLSNRQIEKKFLRTIY